MAANILNNISRNLSLTKEEEVLFLSMTELRIFPKKTIILREGEVCQFEGYITKGCVRIFYLNEAGIETTLSFAIEDFWITEIESFYENKPSKFFIETLEDTEMIILTPRHKEQLLHAIPKLEKVFRLLLQRNVSAIQNRLINMMSKTATERYLEFVKNYPNVFNRVPQYYIASYLGVTPPFISTIRRRIIEERSFEVNR